MPATAINRNLVFQVTLIIVVMAMSVFWIQASRERTAHKLEWNTYQTITRLIDKDRNFVEAEKLLRDLIARQPDSAIVRFRHGYTLAAAQDHQAALAAYADARRLDPFLVRDSTWLLLNGDSEFQLGAYAKAKVYLEAALAKGDLSADLTTIIHQQLDAIAKKGTPQP